MGLCFSTPQLCRESYQQVLPPQCLSYPFLPHQVRPSYSHLSFLFTHCHKNGLSRVQIRYVILLLNLIKIAL